MQSLTKNRVREILSKSVSADHHDGVLWDTEATVEATTTDHSFGDNLGSIGPFVFFKRESSTPMRSKDRHAKQGGWSPTDHTTGIPGYTEEMLEAAGGWLICSRL